MVIFDLQPPTTSAPATEIATPTPTASTNPATVATSVAARLVTRATASSASVEGVTREGAVTSTHGVSSAKHSTGTSVAATRVSREMVTSATKTSATRRSVTSTRAVRSTRSCSEHGACVCLASPGMATCAARLVSH